MLERFAARLLSRAAAALLVVALSGAGELVPRPRPAEHRCQCHAPAGGGAHRCSCPFCHLAKLRALRSQRSGATDAAAARCSSRCDGTDAPVSVAPDAPRFTLPGSPVLVRWTTSERLVEPDDVGVRRAAVPEVPPPRRRTV